MRAEGRSAPLPDAGAGRFAARQAIERIRSGLFDPLAVRQLTVGEDRLLAAAEPGLRGASPHLCVCGAYGQGKSHTLRWVMDRALQDGFATSLVSLDPRELPFHDARAVWRALMGNLRLPGSAAGDTPGSSALIARWQSVARDRETPPEDLLYPEMPRFFRLILGALARPTLTLDAEQRRQRQHAGYHPPRITTDLRRALEGHPLPVARLRQALRYRRVPDARGPLTFGGSEALVQALRGLARLLRALGLDGLVVLFDEGESIARVRPALRQRSWALLQQILLPESAAPGLFPVFASTEDLLWKMEAESALRRSELNLFRLPLLSEEEWRALTERLIALHGQAYGWHPATGASAVLQRRLAAMGGQETRLLFKALLDELDLMDQARDG